MIHPDKFGVVIPVFNESRIPLLLRRFDIQAIPHVVVVDDGSSDESIAPARAFPVTLLRHGKRRGVGAAIRTGLTYLQENGFEVAVVMAGNNKDDPAEISSLLGEIERGADYVQGSRFLVSAKAVGTPPLRRLITRGVAWLWATRFLRKLTDVTNGFRAYRLVVLQDPRIDIAQPWLDRYELEYYLHYKILALNYRYAEVSVSKQYPADGMPTSKINLFRDAWSLLRPLVLLTLRLRR